MLNIRRAATDADFDSARRLFRAYHAMPGLADCVVGFEEEMAGLPGRYAEPRGVLLLASNDGEDIGVVALRPLHEEGVCEMKRLYVDSAARGTGAGRALVLAVIQEARERGYRIVRLDTLPFMERAIEIYRSLGFNERGRYYEGAPASALFFELDLENHE